MTGRGGRRAGRTKRASRSKAEWVSFAVATALLLAVAGSIGAQWARPARPPELTATVVGEPRADGDTLYVTAEVHNSGTETAEEVQVVAEVVEDGETMEVGEQVVAFLAGGASQEVVFVMDATVDPDDLTFSVQGYTVP